MLIADKDNNSFRQKVSFKCTPKVNLIKTRKKGKKNTDKPTSIQRLPPPIPVKLPKEVKEISKYFKTTSSVYGNKNTGKLYAQVLQQRTILEKFSKLKRLFQVFRQTRSRISRKLSKVMVSPNQRST